MKKLHKILIAFTGILSLSIATSVYADRYDYAKVIDVRPIIKMVRISTPERECWKEQVVHRDNRNNVGRMIIGGVIGGAIGNRFGKGNGRRASIAVGTLIGAGIGNSYGNENGQIYTTNEQRCQVVNTYHEEERVEGYKVKYRYDGEIYHTRMDRHPGKMLRVRVSVSPAI